MKQTMIERIPVTAIIETQTVLQHNNGEPVSNLFHEMISRFTYAAALLSEYNSNPIATDGALYHAVRGSVYAQMMLPPTHVLHLPSSMHMPVVTNGNLDPIHLLSALGDIGRSAELDNLHYRYIGFPRMRFTQGSRDAVQNYLDLVSSCAAAQGADIIQFAKKRFLV